MKKEHLLLLLINLALILGWGAFFLARKNYEFVIYVGVIIVYLGLVGLSFRRVKYPLSVLAGLTIWSALHLAGGGVTLGGGRLYDAMLVRLSETYPIWRYDQLVHIWGFGTATLLAYAWLAGSLKRPMDNPLGVGIVVVMAGLGMGALNEILEFLVSIAIPQSGVGGYVNTSLDLCANLIGALLGMLYIRVRYLDRWAA